MRPSMMLAGILAVFSVLQAGTISGKVTSSGQGNQAISGAMIVYASWGGGTALTPIDTAVTDSQGTYAFTNVISGTYFLAATKTGYTGTPVSASVTVQAPNVTANLVLTPESMSTDVGAVLGYIRKASDSTAIANAQVILVPYRIGQTLDTVQSNAQGRFAFTNVASGRSYAIRVTASGYLSQEQRGINVTAPDTTTADTLFLVAAPVPTFAKIVGTVVDSSSNNQPLVGASLVLRRGSPTATGYSWTPIDTQTSGAAGAFAFDSLPASTRNNPYSVLGTLTGYAPFSSGTVIVATDQIDTIVVKMLRQTKGSLLVIVKQDTTGTPVLSGVAVSAALEQDLGGTIYTATTAANGQARWDSVYAARFSVTASLAGFATASTTTRVPAHATDTVTITLRRSIVATSKTVTGIVRTAAGAAVAGALVTFRSSGTTAQVVLFDTSSGTGDYAIAGIPAGVTGGELSVTASGFAPWAQTVLVSANNVTVNVTLERPTGVTDALAGRVSTGLTISSTGAILLPYSTSPGKVTVCAVDGSVLFSAVIPAGRPNLVLPRTLMHGLVVLNVAQGSSSIKRMITFR